MFYIVQKSYIDSGVKLFKAYSQKITIQSYISTANVAPTAAMFLLVGGRYVLKWRDTHAKFNENTFIGSKFVGRMADTGSLFV